MDYIFFIIIFILIIIYNQDYTKIIGKREISCADTPFWMAKSIFLNTTFIVLDDTTLLCMSRCTLCKISFAYGARKPKVSKANDMKTC